MNWPISWNDINEHLNKTQNGGGGLPHVFISAELTLNGSVTLTDQEIITFREAAQQKLPVIITANLGYTTFSIICALSHMINPPSESLVYVANLTQGGGIFEIVVDVTSGTVALSITEA